MADLAARIDRALAVLGELAAAASAADPRLQQTVLPQVALLRHCRGIATQNPHYIETTGGKLIAALADSLIATPQAAEEEPLPDIATRALASWGLATDSAVA